MNLKRLKNKNKRIKLLLSIVLAILLIVSISACDSSDIDTASELNTTLVSTSIIVEQSLTSATEQTTNTIIETSDSTINEINVTSLTAKQNETATEITTMAVTNDKTIKYNGVEYTIIEVDGGDQSGNRQSKVAVDVGFGDREYWAFTNEYGQLIYVIADNIFLQDDNSEPVNSDGRYYDDEAKVPGTEQDDLDEGHVIADSLGGVSNAYNITPQDSTLNRYGDQAYMEKVIRDAGGCSNFVATITYSDINTQIPSHYHYEYDLMGNHIVDDFDNVNPENANVALTSAEETTITTNAEKASNAQNDLSSVDTNGNGKVTIAEAKAAGYKMPIYSDHWLYPYMDDRDGDGMVGE